MGEPYHVLRNQAAEHHCAKVYVHVVRDALRLETHLRVQGGGMLGVCGWNAGGLWLEHQGRMDGMLGFYGCNMRGI